MVRLVPPNTSLKSSEPTQNLFANGTVGMLLHGNWQIPFINQQMTRFEWGVTYMPRRVSMATHFGGTSVAVSRDCKNPEMAADFVKFLTNEDNTRDYVTTGQFLPVRSALQDQVLQYPIRSDAMQVFNQQARTVPESFLRTITQPNYIRFDRRLADEIDLAHTAGQSPETTVRNIEALTRSVLLGG